MKRTYVKVILQIESPWRVGSWDAKAGDTVETLIDSLTGAPMVPGSGIAGSLRAADQTGTLFGPEPGSDEAHVSPWWILGTRVEDAPLRSRRRVRIDRKRQSAAKRGLFDADEVQSGTVLVYLRGEDVAVEPLLALLSSWRPLVGGGRSIGMGQAVIKSVRHCELDLRDPETLLEYLQPAEPIKRVERLLATRGSDASIKVDSTDPLIVAHLKCAHFAQSEVVSHVVNGSQWKGILRSRVEFIGRSMGFAVCGDDEEKWDGCGTCDVCRAFGSTSAIGALTFLSSPWHGPESSRVRIGIDRFTGGTRKGAWFRQTYNTDVEITLIVREERPQRVERWVLNALLHALRDIDDGLVTIGPEGAAGYGQAQIVRLLVRDQPTSLDAIPPLEGNIA